VVDEAKDGGPRANDDGTNRRKQHCNIQEPRGVPKVNVGEREILRRWRWRRVQNVQGVKCRLYIRYAAARWSI
jgi:hypothetical protein